MSIQTSSFVFAIFTAMACSDAFSVADAAPLNPIPSANVTTQEGASINGQIIVDAGDCPEYAEPAGCFDFLSDNIITRAWCSMSKDFKRNNCWPRPFVWEDRQAVRAPFIVMTNKGWQRENTLGKYHFDNQTGQLNEPGRRRTYWIVTQEIPGRRAIFVHRDMKPEVTLARIDSVQQWVAQIVPHGELPPVLETNLPAPGRPAEEVDRIRIEYLKNMPPPVLPANTSMDTGSTGQ